MACCRHGGHVTAVRWQPASEIRPLAQAWPPCQHGRGGAPCALDAPLWAHLGVD
jgi:hypothetical protein